MGNLVMVTVTCHLGRIWSHLGDKLQAHLEDEAGLWGHLWRILFNRLTDVGRATLNVGLSPGLHQKDAGRALGSLLSASLLLPWWLFLSRHFYQGNKEKQQQNQPEVVRAEGSLGVPVPIDQITCLCAPLKPSLPWRLRELRWGTCLEVVTELPAFGAMARKHIDCMPSGSNRLP